MSLSRPSRSSFKTCDSKYGNMHTIDINAEALEGLVSQTLSSHVQKDNTVFAALQEHVRLLADHSRCQEHKLCNFQQQQHCQYCCKTRLNQIVLALSAIIEDTPSLPAHVTAETHSKIGLLRQKQGNATGAVKSFLKALWIQSSLPASATDTTDRNDLQWKIAMTKHRLGLAFGRSGNFKDAIRLLQNAVQDYRALLPDPRYHDKLLQQAKTALQNTMEAQAVQTVLKAQKSPSPPRFGRSNTIPSPVRRAKSADTNNPSFRSNATSSRRRASFATMA